jgi:hypothetical protein
MLIYLFNLQVLLETFHLDIYFCIQIFTNSECYFITKELKRQTNIEGALRPH